MLICAGHRLVDNRTNETVRVVSPPVSGRVQVQYNASTGVHHCINVGGRVQNVHFEHLSFPVYATLHYWDEGPAKTSYMYASGKRLLDTNIPETEARAISAT